MQQIVHVVKTWGLMDEKSGGGKGSTRKGAARVGFVGEGDSLFGAGKEEGVLADDLTGADRVDGGVGEELGQSKSSAAWSVFFAGMMGLN